MMSSSSILYTVRCMFYANQNISRKSGQLQNSDFTNHLLYGISGLIISTRRPTNNNGPWFWCKIPRVWMLAFCYWIMPGAFIIVNGIFLVWDDTKYSCAVMWHVRFPQLNIKCMQWDPIIYGQYITIYRKTSNIRCTLVGNKIVDHSDVVGASPVGAAPTTS